MKRRCPNCKKECKIGIGVEFDDVGNIYCLLCEKPILAVTAMSQLKIEKKVKSTVVPARTYEDYYSNCAEYSKVNQNYMQPPYASGVQLKKKPQIPTTCTNMNGSQIKQHNPNNILCECMMCKSKKHHASCTCMICKKKTAGILFPTGTFPDDTPHHGHRPPRMRHHNHFN